MNPKTNWSLLEWLTFGGFLLLIQLLGAGVIALCFIWFIDYRGGVAWTEDLKHEFNWHPILMTVGFIYLFAQAMIVYRALFFLPKFAVKVIHAAIQALVIILVGVSLKAVFDSHNLPATPIPNLYSLHSWLGILTVALFSLQLLCGFFIFLLPGRSEWLRSSYLSLHTYFGVTIFTLGIGTALTGILEKGMFSLGSSYSKRPPEAYIVNFFGIVLVVFAVVVVFVTTREAWKRPPDTEPSESVMRIDTHEEDVTYRM